MNARLAIAAVAVCLVVSMVAAVSVWLVSSRPGFVPPPAEDPTAVRAEVIAAFQNAPAVPPPDGVKELFNEFGACMKAGGAGGERHWDFPRFIRESDREGSLARAGVRPDNPDFRRGMNMAVPGLMKQLSLTLAYEDTDIRAFRWLLPDREGLVIARHRMTILGETVRQKMRWWVIRDGDRWQIFDFEDVSLGGRASVLSGSAITEVFRGGRNLNEMRENTRLVLEAQTALLSGEFEKADGMLEKVRRRSLPRALAPLMEVWAAIAKLRLDRPAEALALLTAVERELPDSPAVYELQASAHALLEDHDRAVAAANRYIDLIGPDDSICLLLGNSLLALDRRADAAREYRRALDDDPECVDALFGLRACLGADEKGELGDRLARSPQPVKHLAQLVNEALDEQDPAAARIYVAAARKAAPDHPETLAQAGRLALREREAEAGIELFLKALDKATKDNRVGVFRQFAREAAEAGKAVEAYRALKPADAREGFRRFAEALEDELDLAEDAQPFDELIAAHEKRHPDDPWTGYFKGVAAAARNDYDRAEALFAAAMDKATDDETRGWFRSPRVSNLIAAGRAEEAYAKVGPRASTFQQIMHALWRDEDTPVLAKIVAAHGKAEPKDPALPRWRGEVHFRKGEYEAAVRELRQYLEDAAKDEDAVPDRAARGQLVRSLMRLKRFDDARAELRSDHPSWNEKLLAAAITASAGDVEGTEAALDALLKEGCTVASFHNDKDLAAALRTEKFKRLLEKYPPPKDDGRPGKKV